MNRPQKWCIGFRKTDLQTEVTTNNYIESFHKYLKHHIFQKKINRRLDTLIDALMKIEAHYYMTRLIYSTLYSPEEVCLKHADRHQSSLSIPDNAVTHINERQFHVQSSTGSNLYTVTQTNTQCSLQSCFKKCSQAPCNNLCQHMYTCNCHDQYKLCKHIHKVHSIIYGQTLNSNHTEVHDTTPTSQSELASEHKKQFFTLQQNILKLQQDMENPELRPRLSVINSVLETVIKDNEAFRSCINAPLQNLSKKVKIPPNKKTDKQPRFTATEKRRGRKKTTSSNSIGQSTHTSNVIGQDSSSSNNIGHVADYPPLRLVPPNSQFIQPRSEQSSTFINENGQIQIPYNIIIPPSLENVPIPVERKDGRKIIIKISNKPTIPKCDL
ncbi:uncharacterized protein LOC128551563 [Mercenaria mercenaria]|uniref:uncharacterized protein LOC128551563 n=1 Tax=Mercenaria mercenaria TaxID=6596 RepID=UPI00234F6930|nr:uncharacterized protein LOC128551563 [Mercenaria mercenaria]